MQIICTFLITLYYIMYYNKVGTTAKLNGLNTQLSH